MGRGSLIPAFTTGLPKNMSDATRIEPTTKERTVINPMQPSNPQEIEFQALRLLSAMLTDPKGYADKLKELEDIHRNIRAATVDHQAAFDVLQAETDKTHKAVAAAKAEADQHIARQQTELDVASAAIQEREKVVAQREANAEQWEKQLGQREKKVSGREQAFRDAVSLVS
jgi:uncharacterized protein (DUF3084 family)